MARIVQSGRHLIVAAFAFALCAGLATGASAAVASTGTFGQQQVGTATDGGGANYLDASGPYAVAATVDVTSLSGYVAGGSSVSHLRGVVYADSSGTPGAFVAVTSEVTIPAGQAAGWITLPVPGGVSLPAGSYWLGYWYADAASKHYYVTTAGSERYAPAAYASTGNPPASFGASQSSSSDYSLYATYGSGGGTAPANTAAPTISGTATRGQTLTVSDGTWTNSPTGFYVQWRQCDSSGATCSDITGDSGNIVLGADQSYQVRASDVGHTLRAVVTAVNASGSASAVSAATATVTGSSGGSGAVSFVRHSIPLGTYGQVTEGGNVGDIDGDGKPDVVIGGDSYLVWYHNPDWTPHLIYQGANAGGSMVVVADVNGDGRNDVITGTESDPSCTTSCEMDWFENTGSGWVKHVIETGSYCHDMVWVDLNGDGRPDLACDDLQNYKVVWFEHPVDPTQPWPVHLIASSPDTTMGMQAANIDGDGCEDIVAGMAWYDNVNCDGSTWVRYPYTTMPGPGFVGTPDYSDRSKMSVVDLNGDGRPDIVAALYTESPSTQLWAFLAPADPKTEAWTPVEIDPGPLFSVHSLGAADFDGSGRPQIMVGESDPGGWNFGANPNLQLDLYELVGSNPAAPSSWTKTTIDTIEAHELRVDDIDGDGLPDLIANTENSDRLTPPQNGEVHWWQDSTGKSAVAPTNAAAPTVFGTATQGDTLTSASDGWTGTTPIKLAYQWQDCNSSGGSCTAIAGATGSSYLLGGGDVGDTVRLAVTASNSAGSNVDTSAATAAVSGSQSVPASTAAPSIAGAAQQGTRLTATSGSWTNSPGSFAYQWLDCSTSDASCTPIAGATRDDYVLAAGDAGHAVRVRVTATNSGGSTVATAAATASVAATGAGILGRTAIGPLQTGGRGGGLDASGPYTLASTATVSTLTAYLGDPESAIALRAAIYADNGGRPGALVGTSAEETIAANAPAAWVNFHLASPLTLAPGSYWLAFWLGGSSGSIFDGHFYYDPQAGTDDYVADPYSSTGSPSSTFGSPTAGGRAFTLYATYLPANSVPASTSPPVVSGSATVGSTLQASTGNWTNNPTSYAYQWQDCDTSGNNCTAIGNAATASSYTVQSTDAGNTIRVQVTATNTSGSGRASSAQTAVVPTQSSGGSFGQQQTGTQTDNGGANYLDVSGPYTITQTTTVNQLTAYLAGGTTPSHLRAVIYTDTNGAPGTFVAATPDTTVAAGQTAAWTTLPLSSAVTLNPGSYWLGYWYADANATHYYVSQTGAERYAPAAYSTTANPPTTFPTPQTSNSSYSLYAHP